MAQKPHRILGVDPGLGTTGYALLSLADGSPEPLLIEGGILRSDARAPFESRLNELFQDLTRIIKGLKPDVMAVENLYSHYKHPRTSIIMGHARGVIFLAASLAKVSVRSYAATEIKKSLAGAGRATKRQIQQMVQRRLGLRDLPEPEDLADAIAAAYCHVDRTLRRPALLNGRPRR